MRRAEQRRTIWRGPRALVLHAFFFVSMLLLGTVSACSVEDGGAPTTCPDAPSTAARLSRHDLRIHAPNVPNVNEKLRVDVEFAFAEEDTRRGLMYRKEVPPGTGMLFKMPLRAQSFWMKNTCVPLDMIFASEDGTILGFVTNARPFDETPRGITAPSRYVLELPGGTSDRADLRSGDKLVLPLAVRETKTWDE